MRQEQSTKWFSHPIHKFQPAVTAPHGGSSRAISASTPVVLRQQHIVLLDATLLASVREPTPVVCPRVAVVFHCRFRRKLCPDS